MRFLSTFVAGCLIFAASSAFAGNLLVSQMEDGDRIEVTEHSVGCFHDRMSYYEIQKSHGSYIAREYDIIWGNGNPPPLVDKRIIDSVVLNEKQVRGLDGLLKFYRGPKDASSTTVVSLLFEYYEGKKRVEVERLSDDTGGYGLDERKDVVTFNSLFFQRH